MTTFSTSSQLSFVQPEAHDCFSLLVYKNIHKFDNNSHKFSVALIGFSFYWFRPTAEKSDPASERESLNSSIYQQRKMLLGDRYLDRSLRGLGHRRCPPAAVRIASLPTAMAAASRLESLCTQLLTHDLPGSRRKPALEPLPSASPVLLRSLFARGQQGWSFHMTHMRALSGGAS